MSDVMHPMPVTSRATRDRQPLFMAVCEQLVSNIQERYEPGDRLASEPELATAYGVSRPTMREVLRTRASEGLVSRVHGVGTFVTRTQTAVTNRLDVDLGVTEAVVAANKKLGIQVLRIAEDHASPVLADRLEIPLGSSQGVPSGFLAAFLLSGLLVTPRTSSATVIPLVIPPGGTRPNRTARAGQRTRPDVRGRHWMPSDGRPLTDF
jgi:DNA-binding transcriptional regulator YhcF (GntR family)